MVVECPFLKRLEVSDRQSIKILREVVGLDAEEKNADLLIIDERKGRRVAKQMELKIIGTIGVLLHAFDCKNMRENQPKLLAMWKKFPVICGKDFSRNALV